MAEAKVILRPNSRGIQGLLEPYFASVATALETTLSTQAAWGKVYDGTPLLAASSIALTLSLVPVLPALIYFGLRWAKVPEVLRFHAIDIPIRSFPYWYIVMAVVSGAFLGLCIWYTSRREEESKPVTTEQELLTQQQMCFALCYALKKEIDLFRTNKRSVHIEKAKDLWYDFFDSLVAIMRQPHSSAFPFTGEDGVIATDLQLARIGRSHRRFEGRTSPARISFFREVRNFTQDFTWFELTPRTTDIIAALNALKPKVRDRIFDRKDLADVSKCLEPLATFLYTQIADVVENDADRPDIEAFGNTALSLFISNIQKLSDYESQSDSRVASSRQEKKDRLLGFLAKTVNSASPAARFASIWVIVQVFVAIVITFFLSAVKNLRLDSTLVALAIGSPLAVAAAITAVPFRTPPEKQRNDVV